MTFIEQTGGFQLAQLAIKPFSKLLIQHTTCLFSARQIKHRAYPVSKSAVSPSTFQEDDLWVVKASFLSQHMMDGPGCRTMSGPFPSRRRGPCYHMLFFTIHLLQPGPGACVTICQALEGQA